METDSLPSTGTPAAGNSKRRIRLRAVQAACGVALLEALPGGVEMASLVGIDPLGHVKRKMLSDLGVQTQDSASAAPDAKLFRRATTQITLGLVTFSTRVLKGTSFAGAVVKRAGLLVTVVVSVSSGIGAYREITKVGFAALEA